MTEFNDFCKEQIKNKLPEWVGCEVYMCVLGQELTQGMNCNSRKDVLDYLREWWDDASDYWEFEKIFFGEHSYNPFENPEAYLADMVIEGLNSLMRQCTDVDDNWDKRIKLTQEMCDSILEQIESLEVKW